MYSNFQIILSSVKTIFILALIYKERERERERENLREIFF